MKTKFTPGPWTLKEASRTIPIIGANGKTVASVSFRDNDIQDARLIAAAPEMYEALQAARQHLLEPKKTKDVRSLIHKIGSILVKVEGV